MRNTHIGDWWKLYVALLGDEDKSVRSGLRRFNSLQYSSLSNQNPISNRSIRGFGKSSSIKGGLPKSKTARLLLEYLNYSTKKPDNDPMLAEMRTFLQTRLNETEINSSANLNPFAICAGEQIANVEHTFTSASNISGYYRIIRYNDHAKALSADLLYIDQTHNTLKPILISESGQIYHGNLSQTLNMVHFLLVCPTPRHSQIGFSVRYLLFKAPSNVFTTIISGIMARTSNTLAKPIASCVLLDKCNNVDLFNELKLSQYFSENSVKVEVIHKLNEAGVAGLLAEDVDDHKRYCEALSMNLSNVENPIRKRQFRYSPDDHQVFDFLGPLMPPDADSLHQLFRDREED